MDAKDGRQSDPFRLPAIPTQVFCLHCQQEYESYLEKRGSPQRRFTTACRQRR